MNDEPETKNAELSLEVPLEIRAALAALPRSIEPTRDLWPEIARRTSGADRARRRVWMERLAAGILLLVAGVLLLRLRLEPTPAPVGPLPTPVAVPVARTAYSDTDRELQVIRDELRGVVESKAPSLAPETRQLIFENLATIERAIAEIEAALAKEPANADLGRTYIAYRQRQIDLLHQVNRAATRL